MKQVWFPGVHCDVGGGYPEADSGLSKFALQWMIEEARRAGLLVDDERVALVLGARGQGFAAPNADACLHESLTGPWRLAEYVWNPHWNGETEWRANHFARRAWPKQPIVHDAAWLRSGGYSDRLPTDAVRLGTMGAA